MHTTNVYSFIEIFYCRVSSWPVSASVALPVHYTFSFILAGESVTFFQDISYGFSLAITS